MIDPLRSDLARLALAQQWFERLRERTLLRVGAGLCDLAYANPRDGPPRVVVDAIAGALATTREMDLQYTPYGGATITRRLIAHSLGSLGGRRLPWRNVVLTPGAMAALNVLFRAVRRDGRRDEAVVVVPCWLDYPLYLAHLGYRTRFVTVQPGTLRLDLEAIGRALTPATRLMVLSQPSNPTGLLHSDGELRALGELLARAPAPPLLVSDECHRELVFDGETFVSPAEHYDATCVVYSFGKSWFMQGQRIGYVAVSPRFPEASAFATALETWCRVMGFCTPTALMQLAVRALLGQKPDLSPIARRRERALPRLQQAGYTLRPSQGTFFLYPRVPGGEDEFTFAERLARAGVLVLPSPLFHHRGHFRLSLTAGDDVLDAALEVLAEAGDAEAGT